LTDYIAACELDIYYAGYLIRVEDKRAVSLMIFYPIREHMGLVCTCSIICFPCSHSITSCEV